VNGTSITDFSTVERTYIEDSDASPVRFFNFYLTTDAEQFSQEIRFDGETERFRWLAGVYYMDLDIGDSNGAITDPIFGPGPTPGAEAGLDNPYRSQLESMSVFGQMEFPFSDALTLIVGGRVIRDEKEFDYVSNVVEYLDATGRGFHEPQNLNFLGEIASYHGERTDTDWAARVQLDWVASDDMLVYTSWNRGVKGGGYNSPFFPLTVDYTDEIMSYDPETLDAFEVGFKSTLSDGRVRFNGAVYYYDYQDYQAFTLNGLDAITFNTDATSKGAELEFQASPTENWDIILGAAWNDIEVDTAPGVTSRSIQSPEWNLNGLVRYTIPLSTGQIALQVNGVYLSEHIFALSNLPNVTENGYTVFDASISYATNDGKWILTAFMTNFTDEEYLVQTFDLSTTDVFGMTEQYYGRPRWWGLSARYSWGN
jgi:iron complex outermembrane receptor protein